MKIGILHEGKNDELPLKTLLRRIVPGDLSFNCIPGRGQILTKVTSSLEIFFGDPNEKVDLVFLVSDIDRYPNREKEVREILTNNKYFQRNERIVTGFPDPNFEQWLLSEEDAVKAVFNLQRSEPLPHSEIKDPKERLQKIINESDFATDFTLTDEEIYSKIAEKINLKKLSENSSSFQKFISCASKFIVNGAKI